MVNKPEKDSLNKFNKEKVNASEVMQQVLHEQIKGSVETTERMKLENQYNSIVQTYTSTGVINTLEDNQSLGITTADSEINQEYPVPTLQQISKLLSHKSPEELSEFHKEIEAGTIEFILEPFGMKLDTLMTKYFSQLVELREKGKLIQIDYTDDGKPVPKPVVVSNSISKDKPLWKPYYKGSQFGGIKYCQKFSKQLDGWYSSTPDKGYKKEEILNGKKENGSDLPADLIMNFPGWRVLFVKPNATGRVNKKVETLFVEYNKILAPHSNEIQQFPETFVSRAMNNWNEKGELIVPNNYRNGVDFACICTGVMLQDRLAAACYWYRDSQQLYMRTYELNDLLGFTGTQYLEDALKSDSKSYLEF